LLSASLPADANENPSPEFIARTAVRIESISELPDKLYHKIKNYKVIAVGEMHGTREAPAFILGLLRLLSKKDRPVLLLLEIGTSEQAAINSFLKSGRVEILMKTEFFSRDYQDGRSSRAMADLLAAVRTLRGVEVICMDPSGESVMQARDTRMAANISAAFSKHRNTIAVVLAGNTHSSIARGVAWDKTFRPMGYELHASTGAIFSRQDILAIQNRFVRGKAWVCSPDCKVTDLGPNEDNYAKAVPWAFYFLKESGLVNGYNAAFFSRTINASLPLNRPAAER